MLDGRLVAILFQAILTVTTAKECRSGPLGPLTGRLQDWQLSASSVRHGEAGCHVRYAVVLGPPGRAWCPAHDKDARPWIQLDLGVAAKVTGLLTQGRGDGQEWVTSFWLAYSMDAFHWKYVIDSNGNRKAFRGNVDSHGMALSYLDPPVRARFLRLHLLHWNNRPALRVEPLGCQECNEMISLPPVARLSASSWRPWHPQQGSCSPDEGHFFSSGGWCALRNNGNQWVQVDLGPPTRVTGVATRGRGDSRRKQWVTAYRLAYSNDSMRWFHYKDDNHLDPKEFGGNMDRDTERRHYLNAPFVARYVRFQPTSWKRRAAMRVAVIGCPHQGDCGPGFLRVREDSECEENLAFKRDTWVNDERFSWSEWTDGHSSFAVDGDLQAQHARHCAILDNYYVDQPLWMVDLGETRSVRGLLVVTWHGRHGQHDRSKVYHEVYNLEKLTAYVADRARLEAFPSGNKCASVSRLNNGLQKHVLHFECPESMEGRYVYLKATGSHARRGRLFSAVLCEVMVY
ncbi:lactadherin-like [Ornithodoros turicata]|uniref:lactadherin-like n=1 Tax=Ornithodoros turicata TaxID=34597 RepID=UPI003138C14D